MKKVLKVPLTLQPNDKPWCAPACAKMVLAFHGRRCALKHIVSGTKTTARGTLMLNLAIFFLKKNFDVTIMLWDCSFPDRFAQLDEAHTNAEILRWYRKQYFFEWSKKRMLRKILREFNEHGGIIKAKHVSVEDIAGALAKDCPPILFVKTDALDKNVHAETKYDRHCIIPIATYRKTIRVADPNLRGTTVYSLKQIFDACHGTYPTSALFITPREE